MTPDVKDNLELWLENPYWKEYYEKAPESLKEYIALDFYLSETEDDEVAEELDAMEDQLTLEDWRYLLKYSGNDPNRKRIMQKIAELEQ